MKNSKKHVNKYKSSTNETPIQDVPKDYKHGQNIHRTCLSKKKYRTKAFAEQQAKYYTEKFGKQQYVYYCPYCFKYHLTTVPR